MTCKEKLRIEHPEYISRHRAGGCYGCPDHYGYLPKPDYCLENGANSCTKCWDRKISQTEKTNNGDSRLVEELMRDNKDLRIELREAQTRCDEKDLRLLENSETISNLRTKLKEFQSKLDESDRYLTDNTKALLSIQERLEKYEANGECINKKASDYRMKFDALKAQGFTEDQIMQLLPMWMDD